MRFLKVILELNMTSVSESFLFLWMPSKIVLIPESISPSNTNKWLFPLIRWNPVMISNCLLVCSSLLWLFFRLFKGWFKKKRVPNFVYLLNLWVEMADCWTLTEYSFKPKAVAFICRMLSTSDIISFFLVLFNLITNRPKAHFSLNQNCLEYLICFVVVNWNIAITSLNTKFLLWFRANKGLAVVIVTFKCELKSRKAPACIGASSLSSRFVFDEFLTAFLPRTSGAVHGKMGTKNSSNRLPITKS